MTVLNLVVGSTNDTGSWTEGNSGFLSATRYIAGWAGTSPGRANGFSRYTNVTVDQGATINSAAETFNARFNRSLTTVNATLSAIDDDDAAAPTTYAGAEGATRTTASVAWSNIGTWSEDSTYATPDLSAVTQEIVDRGGWASGNALVNYSEDNGSSAVNNTNRIADDFGSGPAPEFDIDYTAGGGGGAARPFLRRRTRRFQRAF